MHFVVDHGQGLQAGAPVLVQGIEVGEVGEVRLTAENRVLVTCQITSQFRDHIRQDAVAYVVPPPLLGGTKVEIDPGEAAEPVAPGQELAVSTKGSFMDLIGDAAAGLLRHLREKHL